MKIKRTDPKSRKKRIRKQKLIGLTITIIAALLIIFTWGTTLGKAILAAVTFVVGPVGVCLMTTDEDVLR